MRTPCMWKENRQLLLGFGLQVEKGGHIPEQQGLPMAVVTGSQGGQKEGEW